VIPAWGFLPNTSNMRCTAYLGVPLQALLFSRALFWKSGSAWSLCLSSRPGQQKSAVTPHPVALGHGRLRL